MALKELALSNLERSARTYRKHELRRSDSEIRAVIHAVSFLVAFQFGATLEELNERLSAGQEAAEITYNK